LIKDSCEKTVTVIDETKPVLSGCPSNVTVDFCNIPAPANVTATDNCPSPGTQVLVEFFETRTNGSNGCSNVITRKWRATDACGNKDSCMQTITIQDQDDPLITCPPAVTIKCADDRNDFTKTGYPFTSDNCGIASVTKSDNPASPACGTTFVRTWTVTDNAGRTASCTQNITILAAPSARLATENVTSTSSETTTTITTNKLPVTKSKLEKTVVLPTGTGLQVKAYPNPFSRMVNFSFVSSKSGRALLEVYNALGQKVGVAFEGWLDAGVQKTVRYTIPLSVSSPIIYRLQVGDKSAVEKLLRQ
jgi:hypothetical protein